MAKPSKCQYWDLTKMRPSLLISSLPWVKRLCRSFRLVLSLPVFLDCSSWNSLAPDWSLSKGHEISTKLDVHHWHCPYSRGVVSNHLPFGHKGTDLTSRVLTLGWVSRGIVTGVHDLARRVLELHDNWAETSHLMKMLLSYSFSSVHIAGSQFDVLSRC